MFSDAAGPANWRAGLELDKPGAGPAAGLSVSIQLHWNLHSCLKLSVPDDCLKYLSLYETYAVLTMYKYISCAAFKIKLTTGRGNAGTCEKLYDRSRIRLRQKAGACASALALQVLRILLHFVNTQEYCKTTRNNCGEDSESTSNSWSV